MRNRIKRFLSIMLMWSVLVGACGIVMANASENAITVSADPITAQAGDQFEVPIRMFGGQGIMGFSITFTYDETAMKPVSVSPSSGIPGAWENSIETSTKNSFIVVWCATENMTAQGTVFTLTFEAKANASGAYAIQVDYDQASTFNEAWQDVVLQTGSIDVQIDNDHPLPEFSIPDAAVVAGEAYSCDVAVRNNTGFGAVTFTLSFDSTALTPVTVQPHSGEVLSSDLNSSAGIVRVVLDQVPADSADGVLFTVVFVTAPAREGSFPIFMTNSAGYVCKAGSVTLMKNVSVGKPIVDVQEDISTADNTITVPVYITNNTGIMGVRLRITLDSTKFELSNCERGSVFSSGVFDYLYDSSKGTVDILWANSEASFINGVCCVLTIQIIDESADTLTLSIDYAQEDTFDEHFADVELVCENAEIPICRLAIQADAASIMVGENLQLKVEMLHTAHQPETIIWSSSNADSASVDETGLVQGLKSGDVIITADDGNGHTATAAIQILPAQEILLIAAEGATTVIDADSHYIYGLKGSITRAELEENYLAVSGNGRLVIRDTGAIGTGTVVDLVSNFTDEVLETYEIVIFGDINGDGMINSTDVTRLRMMSANMETTSSNSVTAFAADVYADGNVNSSDTTTLRMIAANMVTLDQATRTISR